jgi:hypothetical protein
MASPGFERKREGRIARQARLRRSLAKSHSLAHPNPTHFTPRRNRTLVAHFAARAIAKKKNQGIEKHGGGLERLRGPNEKPYPLDQ